jgi:amino acid transporter
LAWIFLGVMLVVTTIMLIIVLYALIAIAMLVSRLCRPNLARPFRMPFWPVLPMLALIDVGVAITR